MKTCATCRFMAADRDDYFDTLYDEEAEGHKETAHQTCVRIIHGNGYRYDGEYGPVAKQPAAVLDGSGYAARLVVLPTFGCVLHEEKE